MNRFRFVSLILMVLVTFQLKAQKQATVKVISYNIWNGYDWGKDEARRGELVNWMKEQGPDIVGLQELCKYSDKKLTQDAAGWGHDYSVLLKTSGYSVGLTSKYPIEAVEKIREGMHHGALHCKTNGIDVFVVHLSPSSYKKRRNEAEIILQKMEVVAKMNKNYLVMGDFNAHSPFDADLYKNNAVRDRTSKLEEGKGENGNLANRELDYAVISKLLSFPLIDISQKYTSDMAGRGSFPGRSLGAINNETDEELVKRMERIDFVLVSEELGKNAVSGQVYNVEANWYMSDHYPVGVEFNIEK